MRTLLFDGNDDISLVHIAIVVNSPVELKNRIFSRLSKNSNSPKWSCERAARINHKLMNNAFPIMLL